MEEQRNTYPFTDEQWWKMCDVHLDLPVPLIKANLTKPFIYDRRWGVFYCPPGYHAAAMGLLLAFHKGELSRLLVAKQLGLGIDPHEAQDFYLEHIPGTAFKSSLHNVVRTFNANSLSIVEKRLLGPLEFVER